MRERGTNCKAERIYFNSTWELIQEYFTFFFLFLFLKEHLMCKGNKGNFHDKVLKRRSIQMSSNYASSKLKHKMSFHFFINMKKCDLLYVIFFLFFFSPIDSYYK